MNVTAAGTRGHDRTAWAAYVLGHHIGFLRMWLESTWNARREAAEERLAVPDAVPPEADELVDAITFVSRAGVVSAGLAAELMGAAHAFRQTGIVVLSQLRLELPEVGEFDWELDATPGMTDWATLWRGLGDAFEKGSLLANWQNVGELLADLRPDWSFPEHAHGRASTLMTRLNFRGEYPFLMDVCRALAGARAAAGSPTAQLLDPITRQLDVHRVEGYVRHALNEGAAPEPWIELTESSVSFLGTRWRAGEFSPTRLGILWLLCERPRRTVTRQTIKRSCQLDCDLENVKSHVTRLGDHLRPAVELWYGSGLRPEHANECFIVGTRESLGPYILDIESARVAVVPPRPDFIMQAQSSRIS